MYGDRIRYFRKQKGMSQHEMADRLNMAPATYSKIETNRTNLAADILEKIAEILEVSPLNIMKEDLVTVNFNEGASNNGTVNSWVNADSVFNYQKDLVDNIIAAKDSENATLKATIETLKQVLNQQDDLVKSLIEKK